MSKIKIVAMMCVMALVVGVLGPVQTVSAACATHSDYKDRVIGNYTPTYSTHNVNTGYYVDGSPIYQVCTITTTYIIHGIYCGVCGKQMSTYTQTVQHHSLSH